jgi:hypothetical protein
MIPVRCCPMRFIILVTALWTVGGASDGGAAAAPTSQSPFRPESFFVGKSEGEGSLKVLFKKRTKVVVRSDGVMKPDGALVLDQTIDKSGSKEETRRWKLREVAPGRYAGTLSDAVGPVTGAVEGNDFRVRYRIKSGVSVDQHLLLQSDHTLSNHMTFRKLGLVIGRMDEMIRHE